MTPAFAVLFGCGVIGLLVGVAALDNLYRAFRCAWIGHDWFIAYPSGAFGGRISQCSRCDRRVVQQ